MSPAKLPPAGYSGTPLAKKLGIQQGTTVVVAGAPDRFVDTLAPLPLAVTFRDAWRGNFALALWFVRERSELARGIDKVARRIGPGQGLWICWPKKSSPLARDLGENDVRAAGLAHGLVDYKVCAVDADWSGLKFARRK
ncbi:MAG: DUF3052 domain-containing protein [Thermoanaerobaculia bacterium]